jgi:hypothetical protein
MGPCQLTSRIVQAHSAVQMFVQRCLQNLETPHVLLGDTSNVAQWREWAWLKNFRVWEAARKVFLYPENWIEPDQRPGKSPFFETLESELLQNEINADNVERALRNYLGQLHAVSSLDIRALYEESPWPMEARPSAAPSTWWAAARPSRTCIGTASVMTI